MDEKNPVERKIFELRKELNANVDTNENGRIKAIVNTKLQEAELFARELYNKDA